MISRFFVRFRLWISSIWLTLSLCHGSETGAPLRVSITPMPVSAPLLLAREMGWFARVGLQVELIEYSLGKLALEDMSRGKVTLACAAVTPLVHRGLAGEDFRIVSTIASSTGLVALVARKDAGIERLSDIAGKRVGFSKGTSGEYFFDTLRVLNRVPKAGLKIDHRSLDGLMAGIQEGSLDVASLWETQISELQRAMPGRLAFFYGNGLYTFNWNLVALPATLKERRVEIEKLLQVLTEAADFIEKKPQEAKEQLEKMGQRGKDIANVLEQTDYRPQLSQDLLVQLEAETRWVLGRDGGSKPVPNYLRFIEASLLEAVRPGAVTIIR